MSKPKIVVLHMRELIYTAIFIFFDYSGAL